MKTLSEFDYALKQIDLVIDEKDYMQVNEWAEENRYLPSELTPMPGPWDNDVAPYLVEIMDCLSVHSPIREMAFKKAAQICATTGILENGLGYIIDHAPGPILYVNADKDAAERGIELRIDRMIETCNLQDKIYSQSNKADAYNRKTGSTKSKKEFPGGFLIAVGANSPSKLRMFSIKYALCDEIDGYPDSAGKEGDPIALIQKRTNAFEKTRKIIYLSTPLILNTSKIDKLYKKGDQRKYLVPCKDCGEFQELHFEHKDGGLLYETDDDGRLILESVHYCCIHCGSTWKNADKAYFLIKGKWVATQVSDDPTFRSYHLNGLYSPVGMYSWEKICQDWLDAAKDYQKLKTFVNTILGEPWEERGKKADFKAILKNRIDYERGKVPDDVVVLTASVDVHKNKFYVEILGWARKQITYSIDWLEIEGDNLAFNGEGWDMLAEVLGKQYGDKNIKVAFIDSGYLTDRVYRFCSKYAGVYPVKGEGKFNGQNAYKTSKVAGEDTVLLIHIAVDWYKDTFFGWLSLDLKDDKPVPWGYPYYPKTYPDSFFKGYTNEQRMEKHDSKGNIIGYEWKRRTSKAFNEPWDCRVYNIAAFDFLVDQIRAFENVEMSVEEFFNFIDPPIS